MDVAFKRFSDFQRGTMYELLKDAYAFESRYERDWDGEWKKADAFFYENLHIADECGFITTLDHTAIGFICWEPPVSPVILSCTGSDGRPFSSAQTVAMPADQSDRRSCAVPLKA